MILNFYNKHTLLTHVGKKNTRQTGQKQPQIAKYLIEKLQNQRRRRTKTPSKKIDKLATAQYDYSKKYWHNLPR